MAETALALNARLLSCPLQSNFVRSWLLRTKWSIPNPMAHQLLKSSWLSAAKHFLFWVPVEGEAGVSLSPRPRKISLEIPAPLPVSSVRETPTWLSKSLFSVRLHQEIPSLWKPILIQSIVCKRGSNQVSEPVFSHGISQQKTFYQIARERKECGWGFRAPPRGCFPGLRVVRVPTSLSGIQKLTTLTPVYLHL